MMRMGIQRGASFDIENRLMGTLPWSFGYAPDNKRVMRVKQEGPTGQHKEIFFYSGNQRLGRYKVTFPEGGSAWEITTVQEEHYFAGRRLTPQDRRGSAADARLLPYGVLAAE